ncbi:9665_t:CDS:2, partial [Cetraspora pellucida]
LDASLAIRKFLPPTRKDRFRQLWRKNKQYKNDYKEKVRLGTILENSR